MHEPRSSPPLLGPLEISKDFQDPPLPTLDLCWLSVKVREPGTPPNLGENEIGLHMSKITHLGPAKMSMFSGKFCHFFHVITSTMSCATTRPPKQVHCDFTI